MADDAAAKKKATDDAEAAAAAAALAWPTGGYDSFIPYLLGHVLAVYMLFIDGSVYVLYVLTCLGIGMRCIPYFPCLLFTRGLD